jgi:K+ transporter
VFDRKQAQPRFWKALLATMVFAVPLTLFARAIVRMTDVVWFALTIAFTLVVATMIHSRTMNDWRVGDTMHLNTFEKRTSVGKNIKIDRR